MTFILMCVRTYLRIDFTVRYSRPGGFLLSGLVSACSHMTFSPFLSLTLDSLLLLHPRVFVRDNGWTGSDLGFICHGEKRLATGARERSLSSLLQRLLALRDGLLARRWRVGGTRDDAAGETAAPRGAKQIALSIDAGESCIDAGDSCIDDDVETPADKGRRAAVLLRS